MTDFDETTETPSGFPEALLAERYLGGDMSPETAAAFEAAADDVELLEQLVVAVQTRDALANQATLPKRATSKRWEYVAAGLAAATVLALVVAFWPTQAGRGVPTLVDADSTGVDTGDRLAPVWVELMTEDPSGDDVDSLETLAFADDSDTDLSDVPDWMYAAIALPAESNELIDDLGDGEETL